MIDGERSGRGDVIAKADQVTNAVWSVGIDLEARGRALGASIRDVVPPIRVGDSVRARGTRELGSALTSVRGWLSSALRVAGSRFGSVHGDGERGSDEGTGDFSFVERSITRC